MPYQVRRLSVVGALALVASLGVTGCKKPSAETTKDSTAAGASAAPPVDTKFTLAVEQKVAPRLEVSGTLDPDERSEIAAQTAGTALSVNIDVGTRVKKGDVLVDLDSREASLRLDVANATTASQMARLGLKGKNGKFDSEEVADVKMAKENAALANTEYERAKQLFESGAISKAQFDAAKSNKDRSDAAFDSARNGAEQAWTSLLASQSQAGLSSKSLDDTKVRAPFDGMIDAKRIAPGEFAAMGRVVAVLVRDDVLRFRFDVPEVQSGAVNIGNGVDISVAAFPGKVFKGEVKRIAASLKSATRTLPIEAELPNPDHKLKAGFFAKAWVQLSGDPVTVVLVPKSSVLPVTGGSKVFVKNGDRVIERLVITGVESGDLIEVRGQIKAGDEVAVANVDKLSDGALIAR